MKKKPAHLSINKQNELKRIISVIREVCNDVEMIILFGSYARGTYKEETDLKPDRKSGHKSDYDILVVTKEKSTATDIELWQKITRECDNSSLSTHVQVIAHDIQELNIKLSKAQYFYSDVRKEGCLLYDSENFKLARKRKLKAEEKKRIAQDYFEHWFGVAQSSYRLYKQAIKIKEYKEAAFNLHQATERSYKTILLVFSNYNPNEHLLGMLGNMAAKYEVAFKGIFPKETKEERELFELLDYAYIGARYDPRYWISKENLKSLSARVKYLLDLTEKICKTKIESITK